MKFEEKGPKAQRIQSARVSEDLSHDSSLITAAASYAASKTGKRDLAFMLREVLRSPSRPSKFRRLIETKPTTNTAYTLEEALALILDLSLSKQQYITLRLGAKCRNADIYPSYNNVLQFKQTCRPPSSSVVFTETVAKIELQALLNFTAQRIVQLQDEVITQHSLRTNTILNATLICSWGFDGSTGQALYKQKFDEQEINTSDQSLFATTLCPLRLILEDGTILWANRIPQSVRLCRPVKIEYVKETTAHILKEKKAMDEEIARLVTYLAPTGEWMIKVTYSLHMTLIDGKILNVITGTPSMQTCPVCKAKPTQFNDLSNIEREVFNPDPGSLKFGISPLHSWIRLLECCLHIAYRIPMAVWKVTKAAHKEILAERKARIQRELKIKLGLNVDMPKTGGSGTTNDGNTARTAFKNIKVFAEVTELDYELLKRFQTILIALSCQLPLDPILFGDYCRCTAELYVHLYQWYPMPSSLHKVCQ